MSPAVTSLIKFYVHFTQKCMNFSWAEENRDSSPSSSALYLFESFVVHGSCRERE